MPDGTTVHGIINLPGLLIAVGVTLLLIRGIKESASFNSVIVLIKVLVVVLFIIAGIGYVNQGNIFNPPCPADLPNCSPFVPYGFSGVITGAAVIFFAYIGFRRSIDRSTGSQESAAGYADGHPRQPGDLYGTLHPRFRYHGRSGRLQGVDQCRRSHRRGDRCCIEAGEGNHDGYDPGGRSRRSSRSVRCLA